MTTDTRFAIDRFAQRVPSQALRAKETEAKWG